MTRRILLAVGTSWACLFGHAAVRAEPVYSFAFGQSSYGALPGQSLSVDVFLQEVVGPGETSLLATEGLSDAGVRVVFDDPGPSQPAQVLDVGDIFANPAFDFEFGPAKVLDPGNSAGLSESVSVLGGSVLGSLVAPDTYRVHLGTFRFTAGSSPGGTTTLRATDLYPGSGDAQIITATTGTVLDARVSDGFATIRSVPEPSSLLLLGTGLIAVAWRRSRPWGGTSA